ncbi:peroxiredoxin family protein [Muriicola soli]|uniref:TlpA family protein disulfide reductase n=1 Tax=Muriicola soli TaxID=2507538 RepID=A0A411E9E1_9FLAO|nr:TlpA disulfide reductase family protein [Muriicola soli]QBA64336.1 TlpA family protein disulfide reductase [Muriicola soli]
MKKSFQLLLLILIACSCKEKEEAVLNEGIWRAEMEVQDGQLLPFNFLLKKGEFGYSMEVYNAEETVKIDDFTLKGDSITIQMPVFDGYFAGIYAENLIEGEFIKDDLERNVPFKAVYGDSLRFKGNKVSTQNIEGIWQAEFSENTDDAYIAKGIFQQEDGRVIGTIRTTTGDYRYLEGTMQGDSLKLSTFDGAHVFLFLAKVTDTTMNGVFYSGNHFKEPFEAIRNENYELPSEDSLTYLKKGYDKVTFSFPDTKGNYISPDDPQFRDKVVILQIMGTWCPNCLDETKFLVDYLGNNPTDDLKIIALAFEYAKTEERAIRGIERLRDRLEIPYPIVLAQYGTSNKEIANEKLPMLNHILSYPTTIFIDKQGKVRKIHTGFNGPATGEKYLTFKKEFHDFVQELQAE